MKTPKSATARHWTLSLLLCLLVAAAFAHSGGTDRQGGHYDRFTGEYHFHHGQGPHQHPAGVCELTNTTQRNAQPMPYSRGTQPRRDRSSWWLIGLLGFGLGYWWRREQKG